MMDDDEVDMVDTGAIQSHMANAMSDEQKGDVPDFPEISAEEAAGMCCACLCSVCVL